MMPGIRNEIGLFDINFETGGVYCSCEMRRMLRLHQDAPANFQRLLQRVHPEDRRAFCRTAMEPFRPDCARHSFVEFRVVDDDGAHHWLHLERRTIPRRENADEVVRVVGFVLEIAAPTILLRAA